MSHEFPRQRTDKMPEALKEVVENLSEDHKRYCDYRSRGLSKADAAQKAGSKASSRKNLSKVGYLIERNTPGVTDYIEWLMSVRTKTAMVDSIEIVDKMRRVFDESINDGKYSDAAKAAYYLGEMIGVFDKNRLYNPKGVGEDLRTQKGIKNDVEAFKEEGESPDERAKKLAHLVKEIGKLKQS